MVSLDIGRQMGITAEIENYPGLAATTGPQLVAQFEAHADRHAISKFIGEQVTAIELNNRCRHVKTASGKTLRGRTVILASGADREILNGKQR